jgi:hypothetical protein
LSTQAANAVVSRSAGPGSVSLWPAVAHHLHVLDGVGLIHSGVSDGDRRRRYVRL